MKPVIVSTKRLLVVTNNIRADIIKTKAVSVQNSVYFNSVSNHLISHCFNLNPVKGKWFPLATFYKKPNQPTAIENYLLHFWWV